MTAFATLGLFIIDEFSFIDEEGLPIKSVAPQESLVSESAESPSLTSSIF
jgi:hypothetical protein